MSKLYMPVRLQTLRETIDIDFDVFVEFKTEFVRYIESEGLTAVERLQKLKSAKVNEFVFIKRTDAAKYRNHIEKACKEALKSSSMNVEVKVDVSEGIFSAAMDFVTTEPQIGASYQFCEKACHNVTQLILENEGFLENVFSRSPSSWKNHILQMHSFRLASLVVKFAQSCRMSPGEINQLCVASCLHGISLFTSGFLLEEVLSLPVEKFNPKEAQRFKRYPQETFDQLIRNPSANREVLDLILAHEEKSSGLGYPNGLKKLTPLQDILGLCQSFTKKVDYYRLSVKEALKDLMLNDLGHYDLQNMNKLKKLLSQEKVGL